MDGGHHGPLTFVAPDSVDGAMDAPADGWTFGRAAGNLALEPWETMLDEPLAEVRGRFGIVADGRTVAEPVPAAG